MEDTSPLRLTPLEARVLGVLVEKQFTVPDSYPLTINSLITGCNQKTSRDPLMNVSEAEVQTTLDELRQRTLVVESYGASGRVLRYAQNLDRVLRIPQATLALLTTLMLRGPQTPGELRASSDRLYHFADASTLEGYLEEMQNRASGALVVRLPRQPGAREHRFAHLLCGEPAIPVHLPGAERGVVEDAGLVDEVDRLHQEVAHLRRLVENLYKELGLPSLP